MKPIRKAASLLLALLLLCPLFAACSEKTPDAAEDSSSPIPAADPAAAETAPETEADPLDPAVLYDGLPADGYGGYDFRMLLRPNERWISDMAADELNGEAINDAIFRRKSMVSEKFAVSIRMRPPVRRAFTRAELPSGAPAE